MSVLGEREFLQSASVGKISENGVKNEKWGFRGF